MLLTSMAGAAAAGACSARVPDGDESGRPTLAVVAEGAGRWRIRSWRWRGGAWRPAIAHARRVGAGIAISGDIAEADRAAVLDQLRA